MGSPVQAERSSGLVEVGENQNETKVKENSKGGDILHHSRRCSHCFGYPSSDIPFCAHHQDTDGFDGASGAGGGLYHRHQADTGAAGLSEFQASEDRWESAYQTLQGDS